MKTLNFSKHENLQSSFSSFFVCCLCDWLYDKLNFHVRRWTLKSYTMSDIININRFQSVFIFRKRLHLKMWTRSFTYISSDNFIKTSENFMAGNIMDTVSRHVPPCFHLLTPDWLFNKLNSKEMHPRLKAQQMIILSTTRTNDIFPKYSFKPTEIVLKSVKRKLLLI